MCNARLGYALSCRLKVVQSLRHFEHLAAPLAEAVAYFVNDAGGSPAMVMEIVREIGEMDGADLVKDSAATRTIAGFLTELAETTLASQRDGDLARREALALVIESRTLLLGR